MAVSYSLKGTGVERQQVRHLASLANCDERSVIAEIRAQLGLGRPVHGSIRDRVRSAIATTGVLAGKTQQNAARKVSRKRSGGGSE
jgi:hypothetical protein